MVEPIEIIQLKTRITELVNLVAMGEKVVEDFMPNIAKCALQDYGRLNEFLLAAKRVRTENETLLSG
jgi:hypothetical protein